METKTLKQPYKRRATTIYPKCLITFFTFFLLIYLEYSRNGSYLDEGLGIVCLVILLLNVYKISQQDLITIAILIFVELIGLISNLIYEVNDSIFSVLVDALTQSKFILVFYAIKYFLTEKEKRKLINMILPFSRIYIVVAFIFAFISLFVNIGMGEAERYGLHPFRFIFHFSFQFVLVSYLFFGAIIHTDKLSDKQKRFYYVLGVLSILASLKSPGLMFSMLFTFLSFYFQRNNKLSLRIILPIIFVGIWLGEFQIENYLLEETSPRRMFFDYSFKTANTYFPLGSGFGTFGSAEAAKNYSKLYYVYGFNTRAGMMPGNTAFLSDTYWPMAIGQFGWIGAFVYIMIFVRIFQTFKRSGTVGEAKAFQYAIFIQLMIQAIGTAIISSSAGFIAFAALSLYSIPTLEYNKEKNETKIKRIPKRKLKISF